MSHPLPPLPPLPGPLRPGARLLAAVARAARDWPVESQLAARRNAMVASTALTARRAEREDVEDTLRALREHSAGPGGARADQPAARGHGASGRG